ncbi:6-phosphogluconolactonase [Breznakiella homolactica]|uniref:Glucosamine-6-phosphate isomerase n=1 Tax=Breznakiella homolactica TaxID=2798577 RepID=A0A7T7XNB0_9SPIR|nr:glucosamine-6-phosphate isomerase [Breznakiella homolactica]QQO09504.1 glucosamine-6-phosphate isomerase [Breznakiella homolactica]
MQTFEHVGAEELWERSKIPIEIVDTEDDIYYHMALDMVSHISENEQFGKPTVFIVPVGPIGQYRRLSWLCSRNRISLKNTWFINMDEYLGGDGRAVPEDHPLSFEGFMNREFYRHMEPDLNIPESQRIFPRPGREDEIGRLIEKLGGVDVSYGGIGINGHIAFNEPPEPDEHITDEEFAALPTRVLTLTRETRTINAVTAANGYIDYIPRTCVTVGMKEILSAKKIRFYLNRQWQKGIVRKILLGDVSRFVPASFFQRHGDAKLILASYVAEPPMGVLR